MKKVFLAAPFKSLVNSKTMSMDEEKKNEIVNLIEFLEKKGYSVHNAHKREAWGQEFMSPEQCTKIDYDEIEKCDIFIAFPGIPASPGTHIEIGWASAFNNNISFISIHFTSITSVLFGDNSCNPNSPYTIHTS